MKEKRKKIGAWFLTFLKIGAFTFGGGYAMIPLIQKEAVTKRRWIEDKDILDIVAIAESTPGPIAINSATFVGFEVAGVESSIRSLMETIEKGSDIVVVAVFAKDPALSMFHLGEHELRLIGSMMYRHEDYQTAVDFVSKGIVNLKPLISNRFAFEQYDDAYKFIDTHRETSMKVIVDLEQKP